MPAPGLLTKDPEYWKSVHLVGEGLAKEQAEAQVKELAAWKSKVGAFAEEFFPQHTYHLPCSSADVANQLLQI